jgi:hypothetical protein
MPEIDIGALGRWASGTRHVLRQRTRVIQLLDAAERAGVTPIPARRLHAYAYLADVLSPVWNLQPFEGKILKLRHGPHYPDLQQELDRLVVMGLVLVSELQYVSREGAGPLVDADYAINFESPHLENLLAALGARTLEQSLDPNDFKVHAFLVELACAIATLPDEQVDQAASLDATYADDRIDYKNIVDFGNWSTDTRRDNLSVATAERFHRFLPGRSKLSGGEKLYLYASFLGRRMHGA